MLPLGAALVRFVAGLIFVVFGLGKFVSHASEASSFATYDLPHPSAFAYAIGVVEFLFGMLVLVGLRTRVAAVVLAMLFLLWAGPGRWALERR